MNNDPNGHQLAQNLGIFWPRLRSELGQFVIYRLHVYATEQAKKKIDSEMLRRAGVREVPGPYFRARLEDSSVI